MSSEDCVSVKKRGVRNESKATKIKKCRAKGLEYVNNKGNLIHAKTVGESCNCRLKCFKKINEIQRIEALTEVLNLNTKNEQDIFLQSLLVKKSIKQRRPRKDDPKISRGASFLYNAKIGNEKVIVCKKAFCSIYAIKNCALYRLQNLLKSGEIPYDKRGRQMNQKVISGDFIQQIKEHITSFPVKQAHYTSKEYLYLSPDLNIKKMFMLFKEKNPASTVKLSFYYKVFKNYFNLHFGRPQVDTCSECERLNIRIQSSGLNERAVMVAMAELNVHKKRAKKFYTSIQEVEKLCKDKSDVMGLSFDFMQNISLPCIPVQEIFYYRQLSVFNFCIKNFKTNESRFYLYHDGIASKGPNETCSFLYDYINTEVSKDIKILYVFSDGCGGQNKNHPMMSLWQALVDSRRFEKIYHRFPIRGHSFLPNDRSFGTVKKVLKRRDRIYSVKEISEIICNSNKFFSVSMVQTDQILNFKNWWTIFYKRNAVSTETQSNQVARSQKQQFLISQFMEFEFSSDMRGCTKTRPFIGCTIQENTFDLKKSRLQTPSLPTEKAYTNLLPINIKKIEDLKKVIQYIPKDYLSFYINITENWPKTDGNDE
jgi:hypothetical protein